jgi:hypothetical protein
LEIEYIHKNKCIEHKNWQNLVSANFYLGIIT